jgi:hypothetical protein
LIIANDDVGAADWAANCRVGRFAATAVAAMIADAWSAK